MTPFKATRGTVYEGGFGVPGIVRGLGKINPGRVGHALSSRHDWFPTLAAAPGLPDTKEQPLKGVKLGDRTCKRHLDDFKFTFDLEPFVQVQQTIAILAQTAIDLPPMQAPSSFNLEAVKANIDEPVKAQKGQ